MKLSQYLYILFIVALYIINYLFLDMNIFTFTGIVLILLVFLIITINFYVKYQNKKKGVTNDDFIFSEKVASKMKNIDPSIQYESSLISIAFLITGMILFCIYTIFFTDYAWLMKFFIIFNSLCGIVLMGSMLVTNYQQFISYKESIRLGNEFTDNLNGEVLSSDKLMKNDGDKKLMDELMTLDKFKNNVLNNNERRIID